MNSEIIQYKHIFKSELPEMLQLLKELVNIDSGSYDAQGVNKITARILEFMHAENMEIERFPIEGRGDLLSATRHLGGAGRVVVLGHADTVWPTGTVQEWPFAMLGDGLASGPGVGDMKGGLVIALFVLRALLRRGFDELEWLRVVLVPDEELGSVGSRALIEAQVADADAVLVMEPGRPGGGVVTARGALGAYFMHAVGCSAHCANNYHKGASALRELAAKVPRLDGLSRPDEGLVVNVGVLQGGTARQVVPGEARMDIDLRARTQPQAEALQQAIERIAGERDDPRVQVEFRGGLTRPAFTAERNRGLMSLAQSMADALSIEVFEAPPAGGGSDGNFAAALGIATLDGLGPVCHDPCSRQEAIEISSLVDRAALMYAIVRNIRSSITKGI